MYTLILSSICAAAVTQGVSPEPAAKAVKKPNLLFIITDQQRYDALGKVGNFPFLRTPNLDRLASEGAWFTHAYTPCAVSGPARACLLTGQLVEHTNVLTNELTVQDPVKNNFTTEKTFDRILNENGYYSEYHGKWHCPIGWTDCYEGFTWHKKDKNNPFSYEIDHLSGYKSFLREKYDKRNAPEGSLTDKSMFDVPYFPDPIDRRILRGYDENGNLPESELAKRKHTQPDNHGMLLIEDEDSFTAYQAKETIAALKRAHGQNRPFNITMSINYPHSPMLPTSTFHSMYQCEDMPVPESIDDNMTDSPYKNQNGRNALPEYRDPELIKYMMKNYFGLVSEIDYWVGKVLDTLEEIGERDNTIVVFVSDHGEMLGAHGLNGKANFYEEAAHVPMIVSYPGKIPAGTVVDAPVNSIGIYATILDYLGIQDGQTHRPDEPSLRRFIEDKKLASSKEVFAVSEWPSDSVPGMMIRTSEWKLMIDRTETAKSVDALYDMVNDPYETTNLLAGPDGKKYMKMARNLQMKLVENLEYRHSPYAESVRKRILTCGK